MVSSRQVLRSKWVKAPVISGFRPCTESATTLWSVPASAPPMFAQGKWPADLFVSHDAGGSWHPDQRIDSYGHTSVRDSSSTLMMPYEQWPQSPGDRQNCVAPGNVLTMADGALVVEPRDVRVADFPRPLADYHEDELRLQHNGNILRLKDGSLLTTMYGKFDGEEGYNTFAVVSDDGGFSWTYRSTVAGPDAASGAPEGPNESNTLRLDSGDLLCVYRVGGGWDFHKSISADEGRTWSQSVRMEGMASVQPRLAPVGQRRAGADWWPPRPVPLALRRWAGRPMGAGKSGGASQPISRARCGFFGSLLQCAGGRGPRHEYVVHRADALGSRWADRGLRPPRQRLGRRSGTEWGRRSGI